MEDVAYMNAMSDDSPKPTKAWKFPDDATVRDFAAKETGADLERICENSLGFYLVSVVLGARCR